MTSRAPMPGEPGFACDQRGGVRTEQMLVIVDDRRLRGERRRKNEPDKHRVETRSHRLSLNPVNPREPGSAFETLAQECCLVLCSWLRLWFSGTRLQL